MSELARDCREPHLIGLDSVQALIDMSIPPLPTHYTVWFSHLGGLNFELSAEIDGRVCGGKRLDEPFLEKLYSKYLSENVAADKVENYLTKLVDQTTNVQQISQSLHSNTELFQENLTEASAQAGKECITTSGAEAFIESLISTAQIALERNKVLENDLSKATVTIAELRSDFESMATNANTDFLTKLSNRRHFDLMIAELINEARIDDYELCLVVGDIDHFKQFNDTYGHNVGDQVLRLVAGTLKENVKGQDFVARYGGEEFVIVLPMTEMTDAIKLANTIREAVSRRKLINRATNQSLGSITMSFGVSKLSATTNAENLFKAADTALYRAKRSGRNCVQHQSASLAQI